MSKDHGLSKSRIASFLQCPKRLWLEVHHPERASQSEATEAAFRIGYEVGELARAQYPKGNLVELDDGLRAALKQTKALLGATRRVPIFEGTFQYRGVLVRTDLLLPTRSGWHLAEVKSSSSVEPQHINDVAVQQWVVSGAGLPLTHTTIRHINTAFVYRRKNDYDGLLIDAAPDAKLSEQLTSVPQWIAAARKALDGREPKRDTGPHCDKPYPCPFNEYCASRMQPGPRYPVENLRGPGANALGRSLREQGYLDLRKVPAKLIANERFRHIHKATVSGDPYRNRKQAAKTIDSWKYPRAYLDFETICFAVPIWIGTRPYQPIPFQYSCHIERADGSIEHRCFIDLSGDNPARACAERLVADLHGCRTIVAYHAPFERGVIKTLAQSNPKLRRRLMTLHDRIEDLLPLVRECYYHRDMGKSYSIKDVVPCLTPELSYEKLGDVQDGGAAMDAYREATAASTAPARKEQIEHALLSYCKLDSWAMVAVARRLHT